MSSIFFSGKQYLLLISYFLQRKSVTFESSDFIDVFITIMIKYKDSIFFNIIGQDNENKYSFNIKFSSILKYVDSRMNILEKELENFYSNIFIKK